MRKTTEKRSLSKRKNRFKLPEHLHDSFLSDFKTVLAETVLPPPLRDVGVKFSHQLLEYTSKLSDVTTTSAELRRSAAISKWLSAEARNRKTNIRLFLDEPVTFVDGVTSKDILNFARLVVRQTIGEEFTDEIYQGEFTNGASTRVSRGPDAISRKFVGEAHATTRGKDLFVQHVLTGSPVWISALMDGSFRLAERESSVMFTVPKNSEIDRVACKEPEINMYLQRGAGLYLRRALKKRGIDLQDQSINQRLACVGSMTKTVATLDLSSASDLISTELVRKLLPDKWFDYLDAIRVKTVSIDGIDHELEMFSSMGNGFTFELESLIFFALSCAINRCYKIRGRISVYGDDIITPTAIAALYPRIFSWFGFVVNPRKSFWKGRFRESCGRHYHDGFDVTPFYIRTKLSCVTDLCHQLNQLRYWSTRDSSDYFIPQLYELWVKYSSFVPKYLWGGKRIEDKSCLVTPDSPRSRLIASKRSCKVDQKGSYFQWLHNAQRRRTYAAAWSGLETGLFT
ncbi:RNA-directed RNA polymerase, partial [ssRNA phage AIN000]